MQDIQWTTELISIAIIIGITLTTIGFLLAMVLQGRKLTYITTQLEHSQKTIEQTNNTNTEIQAQLKNTQSTLHQKELLESKLQEQFSNAKANEQRLASELAMLKDELTDLGSKLEHMHQQMHISEKKYEAAQAENRALQKQASDLDQRLTQTNQALEKERNLVSELKDYLSQEGKKTKSLEVSEKEAREQLNEIKLKMSEQITDYRQLQERNQSLSNEYTELKTTAYSGGLDH